MTHLQNEFQSVINGTHPELVAKLQEIEVKKTERLQRAAARRKSHEGAIERIFKATIYETECEYVVRRGEMRRDMLTDTHLKKRQLFDEKRRIDNAPGKIIYSLLFNFQEFVY